VPLGEPPRGEGHDRGGLPVWVIVDPVGIALGRSRAPGLLVLQLCQFRVDRAETSLTGHVLPPPHHVGAPEATGGVLELGEPSMDRVRHEGPPSPPAWWVAASLSKRESGERKKCYTRGEERPKQSSHEGKEVQE
jgi:hypothetical protein